MRVRDVLTNETKWIKGTAHRGNSHCLLGALSCTTRDWHSVALKILALQKAIEVLFPEREAAWGATSVAGFNDHPETTFEDVLRVCKVADV